MMSGINPHYSILKAFDVQAKPLTGVCDDGNRLVLHIVMFVMLYDGYI